MLVGAPVKSVVVEGVAVGTLEGAMLASLLGVIDGVAEIDDAVGVALVTCASARTSRP